MLNMLNKSERLSEPDLEALSERVSAGPDLEVACTEGKRVATARRGCCLLFAWRLAFLQRGSAKREE